MWNPILETIFDRAEGVKRSGDSGLKWSYCCPAHEDSHQSGRITLNPVTGKVSLTCYVGCSIDAIVAALGITKSDLYLDNHDSSSSYPRVYSPPKTTLGKAADKKSPQKISEELLAVAQRTTFEQHAVGIARWAKHLGLSPESSVDLGDTWQPDRIATVRDGQTAWHPDVSKPGLLLTPMVDGDMQVVGVAIRDWAGKKWRIDGGSEGLFVPKDFWGRSGPIYLVEGPTDTRAAWDMGLAVIGRSNNRNQANISQLARLLGRVPVSREIIVVGENDRKPNGDWPGRTGAEKTAQELSELLKRPVRAALVPEPFKDTREWFRSPGVCLDNLAAVYYRSLTFFAVFPAALQEVTQEELEQAAISIKGKSHFTYPEELCEHTVHLLLKHKNTHLLRHTVARCGASACQHCFKRKKRLRYEALCRHIDREEEKKGELHQWSGSLAKKDWDTIRRNLKRHGANFICYRHAEDVAVIIATSPFHGSHPLPFSEAREFARFANDNAVVGGRGKPFFSSSHQWAMVREKKESEYEKIGCPKMPPQAIKRICQRDLGLANYSEKFYADSTLVRDGFINYAAPDPANDAFVQKLLGKPEMSDLSIIPMNDSDIPTPTDPRLRSLPPAFDHWFSWLMNPTA